MSNTFSVLVANPKKLLYTGGGQSRSWSAEQGKESKRKKSGSAPPTPHTARSEKINKNHVAHLQALRRSRSVSRPYKDYFDSSTRSKDVASQNSTLLPCAMDIIGTHYLRDPIKSGLTRWPMAV